MIRGTAFWSSPWRETSVVGLADTYLRKQKQAIVCFAPDGACFIAVEVSRRDEEETANLKVSIAKIPSTLKPLT